MEEQSMKQDREWCIGVAECRVPDAPKLSQSHPSQAQKRCFDELELLFNRLAEAAVNNSSDVSAPIAVGARCLVLGFANRDAHNLTNMLHMIGFNLCDTCSDLTQLFVAPSIGGAFTYVFVSLDAFEDVDDAVEKLMSFRVKYPTLTVVLISGAVVEDDHSPHRRQICDATLRSPVSLSRLRDGVLAAETNRTAQYV